jgi:hypothetical protein
MNHLPNTHFFRRLHTVTIHVDLAAINGIRG